MNATQHPATSGPASWTHPAPAGVPWRRWAAGALAVAGLVAAILLLAALANRPPVPGATAQGILSDPGAYMGERVAASGRVEELLTHRALTLAGGPTQDPLLVLVEEPAVVNAYAEDGGGTLTGYVPDAHGPLYRPQTLVWLTGTVERFDRATLASQLDIVLDARLFGSYEGKPVLVVDQLDASSLVGVQPAGAVPSTEPTAPTAR